MSAIADSVARLCAELPAPGRLAEQRAAALAAFRSHGLPAARSENWRYTDVNQLAEAALEFSPKQPPADPDVSALPVAGDRIVFANGHIVDSLTSFESSQAAQIELLGGDWSMLADGFPLNGDVLEHPLGTVNTAAAQHGAIIRTAAGSEAARTVNIVLCHTGEAALALQPRIIIDVGERSSLNIVLYYASDGTAAGWMNPVVELRQAAGSRVGFVQLQEHSLAMTHTALVTATLERDAFASVASFDLGAKLARNDIDIRLAGTGSECEVFGAFLPMRSQHIDTHVAIDHAAAHTQSATVFRGIAGEHSRGVFNGKVIVRPDAQRISAEQSSNNLLLCANAEIDTKPELEIYADDVKCSHGATVGELDEQHLFYLRSRGIDEAAARALLTYAFALSVVERIGDSALRQHVAARIAQNLPEHERWEHTD